MTRPFTAADDARIVALHAAGATQTVIAAELRRGRGTITGRIRLLRDRGELAAGYRPRPFTPEDDARIEALRDEGWRWRDIAREMGRLPGSVQWRARRLAERPASRLLPFYGEPKVRQPDWTTVAAALMALGLRYEDDPRALEADRGWRAVPVEDQRSGMGCAAAMCAERGRGSWL